ncbi:hypothetical protein B0T10DRAFT_295192 [Thelonectria olida]|uniref:NACHT domain-containing protein n=1 Tax=Thelonectria olida TaxID=1576542 RepID=A0A9P8W8Y8_9HYPO|nr:hypothetical protein B0T10DRAFT_295192 [Thelonectria olida]
MLTGFEALGAASAVLQVISFSSSVIRQCYKIYDGRPMPENELEEYATRMSDAASRVQSRCRAMPQQTPDEKKLADIAQNCIDAAQGLQAEAKLVTSWHQKGKLLKAFFAAIRASKHRNKIERLEKSLAGCKEVMETQLILKLCTSNDAIEYQQTKGFQDLESDVKELVVQIANGHTKIEDLIKTEQNTTRDFITMEAKATREEVNTHVTSEVQVLGARAATDTQRRRLLTSLKVHEMNQRYHDVMDSRDATFERVFSSYERTARQDHNDSDPPENTALAKSSTALNLKHWEMRDLWVNVNDIDQTWTSFTSWLRSKNNEIFWIRGKPGSGKSTLMKFVIDNENTRRLLEQWSPGTKILSHFFWKIGSSPQNSIKGLLCSMLHRILSQSHDLVDQVFHRFKDSLSMDSYHDWSVRELENVVFSILEEGALSTCIFIDGLDEISDKDGFSKLMDLVEKLNAHNGVKVCVSSRPETQLMERFKATGATTIRLEDLTRPEMAAYVHKEFAKLHDKGQVSSVLLKDLTHKLLDKAEGVFLWLFLATKSLINGIQNCDDKTTLHQRLEQLPAELEGLYADMWERLNENNSVYRETAGRYFRYVVAQRGTVTVDIGPNRLFIFPNVTLLEVALAEGVNVRDLFGSRDNNISLADLKQLCETTVDNIRTRCAGLLQLQHQRLESAIKDAGRDSPPSEFTFCVQELGFIHRTAHDFLVETEAGQRILNYNNNPPLMVDTRVRLAKSLIDFARTFHGNTGLSINQRSVIDSLVELAYEGVDWKVVAGIALVWQDLYKRGIVSNVGRPEWCPQPPFISVMAALSRNLDDIIIHLLQQADSPSLSADVFRDIVSMNTLAPYRPPIRLVQKIILSGVDPHVIGISLLGYHALAHAYTQQASAFGIFLLQAFNQFLQSSVLCNALALVDVVGALAPTCPNWQKRMLIAGVTTGRTKRLMLPGLDQIDYQSPWTRYDGTVVFCEVDLQFLLAHFLAVSDFFNVVTHDSKLRELANTFTQPFARIRCIIFPRTRKVKHLRCYRVLTQRPFADLLSYLFSHREDLGVGPRSMISDLMEVPGTLREVDLDQELNALAQEGLGFCKLSDVGIFPPVSSDDSSLEEGNTGSSSSVVD